MGSKTFIQKHSIATYFLFVYLIAWVGSFVAVGPKILRGEAILPQRDYWLMGLAMLLAPSILGIALTLLTDGKVGLQELLNKMGKWRVQPKWYAALLIFPIMILASLLLLSALVSPDFNPTFFPLGIIMGIGAGFFEEIGWMGFAFPRLRARTNLFKAAFILGILHVLWHFGADFLAVSGIIDQYWLLRFLAFCVAMLAMRIILVWVYANTESLLMAQLIHVSSTGSLGILVPMAISPVNNMLFYAVYAIALWIVALMIIPRLVRKG